MNPQQDDNIPTLTDIIQIGDESMKGHFDTHYFDDDNGMDEEPVMQTGAQHSQHGDDALRETIKDLIQEALDETLPVIEDQLREQLIRKVLHKLQHADDSVNHDPI